MLRIDNIKKIYKLSKSKEQLALNDVNLEFNKGEFIAIYGPSGSGKSTLLNMLGILDRPTDGEIYNEETKINGIKKQTDSFVSKYRRSNIGFVFQQFNLINHMSVLENVMLPLELDSVTKEAAIKRSKELLNIVGLSSHINKLPNKLSGGEQQRVAIARALANDPDIIIADEPTGALDTKTSKGVLSTLKDISNNGKLVIVVTHDPDVLKYASRIVKIKDGHIIDDENINEIDYIDKTKINFEKKKVYTSIKQGLKFAINNIIHRKTRFLITTLAASISVIGVLLAYGVGVSADTYVNEISKKYDNQLVQKFYSTKRVYHSRRWHYGFTEKDLEEFKKDERIRDIFPSNAVSTRFVLGNEDDEEQYRMTIYSIFPNKYDVTDININEILYGDVPVEGQSQIVITYPMAKYYYKLLELESMDQLIGNSIRIKTGDISSGEYEIKYYEFDIVGIFQEDAFLRNKNQELNMYGYIYLDELNQLIEDNSELEDIDNTVRVIANNIFDASSLKTQYADFFSESEIRMELPGTINDVVNILKPVKYVFYVLVGVTSFAAIIMIAILLHISVVERIKEIGTLKAIGARKSDIRSIFYIEAIFIGITMALFGILFVSMIKGGLNNYIVTAYDWSLPFTPISLNTMSYVVALVMSIAISLVASLYAVTYAANVDPIKALKK